MLYNVLASLPCLHKCLRTSRPNPPLAAKNINKLHSIIISTRHEQSKHFHPFRQLGKLIQPFCQMLAAQLTDSGFLADVYHDWKQLKKRDILFILGCQKILPEHILLLHKHNLVVHESDLPQGKDGLQ